MFLFFVFLFFFFEKERSICFYYSNEIQIYCLCSQFRPCSGSNKIIMVLTWRLYMELPFKDTSHRFILIAFVCFLSLHLFIVIYRLLISIFTMFLLYDTHKCCYTCNIFKIHLLWWRTCSSFRSLYRLWCFKYELFLLQHFYLVNSN